MERKTVTDVRGMFARAVKAAGALGIDTERWHLVEGGGSSAYRFNIGPYGSLGVGYGNNFLGNTARDAYNALHYMARAWELVAEIARTTGTTTTDLSKAEPHTLTAELRRRGHAVSSFTPGELGDTPARRVEDVMVQAASDMISDLS